MKMPVVGDMVRTTADILITKWVESAKDHDAAMLPPGSIGRVTRCIATDSRGPLFEILFEVFPDEFWPRTWYPDTDVYIEIMDPVTAIGTLAA